MEEAAPLPCKDDHQYCTSCIIGMIETKINDGQVVDLECPNWECDEKFTDAFIRDLVDDDVYSKYERFKENIEVNQDKNIKWCP